MSARFRPFSWKSDAGATLPRWKSVQLIELLVVVLVVGEMCAILLHQSQVVIARARLAETLSLLSLARVDVTEHYAITGRALESNRYGRTRTGQVSAVPEYEQHLSAAAAFTAVTGSAAPGKVWSQEAMAHIVRSGVVDGSAIGIGRFRDRDRPYRLSFTPWVRDGGSPAIYWGCGEMQAPEGYRQLGRPIPNDISHELMPGMCRHGVHP
jgi:type II secretory pathway pseudopilin PulG